jgi:SynChlorMet cassette protein ScmD
MTPRVKENPVPESTRPVANPQLVLREEFDDWAVLFDPDTGDSFGMDPVSIFIWKRLDGKHSPQEITDELRRESPDAPEDAEAQVMEFINDALERGLAGCEVGKE